MSKEYTELNRDNELEVIEEEEMKEGIVEKSTGFVKKHWKKIATGAAIAAAGVVGFVLGAKSNDDDDLDIIDLDEDDVEEESAE